MGMRVLMVALLQFVAYAVAVGWDDDDGGGGEWGLVYKTCGGQTLLTHERGKVMEAVLEKGVMSMDIVRNGYYRGMVSEAGEMMGQCEAGLDVCECLQCFTHALHLCPPSLSAQIHLTSCSISYSFYPYSSFPPARRREGGGGGGNNSGSSKTIAAIVVGAGGAVFLALIFLFFLRSRYSKRDYYY